ncbi:FAD-dependent oxidoreductase [Fusibacter ferrireducens]|uniref:NADH:ubiquinone reductase (non-electrogenic) n=1 Tax=Fusibacter ferrireducens TaxID=2785058 RepID=A0ABR9ZY32_9FIRM|nr:FAD-dependent oxidoreductase [Fusibacter ferrireducens]MBF4694785.1 FAD-dependent oxidoreductase [Fusibacter ferrireducens]
MSNLKKVLILGGGYAGVKAGKTLHKIFKKNEDVEITLIDKNPYHTLMTELHEVAGHRTEPDSIRIDLRTIFSGRKVNVVTDQVEKIDFENQKVSTTRKVFDFDYLIIAFGSSTNSFGIPGIDEYAYTLWSYEDAIKIRSQVEKMFQLAAIEEDEKVRRQMLTFAVVGGGFTGVEMAGELGEAKKHLAEKYEINKDEITIYNIEATSRILNTLKDDRQVEKVERRFERLGVTLLKDAAIVNVMPDKFELKDGRVIACNTLIWGAGIKVNNFVGSLGLKAGRAGRVDVNEYMQTAEYPNVFVAGDNTHYEDQDGLLPQIVEAAEQSGHTAAENIANLIQEKPLQSHKQVYHGFMVSVGSRYCVSDNNGLKLSGFFSMLVKHLVNFYYLLTVSGVAQLFEYWRHEFFHIKNNRSFLGGHFSKSSPNFWMVPFRMFLGTMWLIEGLNKINDGWLVSAKMIASDAVTQASEVVEEGASYAEPLLKEVPGVVQWMIDKIIAPHAIGFQTMMVFAEIAFGLMLIAGLFTFISAIATTGMTVAITLTGMSDASILWYFFGGIAMIAGAGSTFGCDYYILPVLKRWWKGTAFAKKSYLYFH